ncbi:MAG: DUF1761 domain-containing protein [Pseudomonadota bacterium]
MMDYLGILLAAIAGFASGSIWYMVNGARWLEATGRTEEEIKADKSPLPFIIAFLASLLTAAMMRHILVSSGISGIVEGLVSGLGVGLFMIAPWILTNYAFAARPRTLWWIDAGHVVLAATAIGAVLGLFL